MFWKRSDQELIDRPIEYAVSEATSITVGKPLPNPKDDTYHVSWKGPLRPDDPEWSNAPDTGVYLITAKLIGREASEGFMGFRSEKLAKGAKDYLNAHLSKYVEPESADFWFGTVRRNTKTITDNPTLGLVRRALVFSRQPGLNAKFRAQLVVVQNTEAPDSLGLNNARALYPLRVLPGEKLEHDEFDLVESTGPLGPECPEPIPCPDPPPIWPWILATAVVFFFVGLAVAHFFLAGVRIAELEARIVTLETQVAAFEARVKALLADKNELNSALALKGEELATARKAFDGATGRISVLETENKRLTGLIQKGGGGIELSSCWQTSSDKFVPVYWIEIHDTELVVRPAWTEAQAGKWPSEYDAVMTGFTEKPIVEETHLSRVDFGAKARPYYDYGVGERNCRFFVEVTDSTTTKESWKSGLAMVERYFYKRYVGAGNAA